jgi:flagellar basal body-associated protein FliL
MNKNVLQVIIVILIMAVAGLIYCQYSKSKTDNNQIVIETPAGTLTTEFESNSNNFETTNP